ncbi:uncharacterized protein LOC116168580 [Photinus pyralis]|uniref:uncharacterized protein LOC116168580 n=1 Tax=Photinus pyralis TaxID=7054 RepID=UPI00126711DD|nr:uncharacterized protein LOC116168580 [Photinus pyralis]
MAKKWSHEIVETLVSLYQLQPVLYKTDSPSYHNNLLRHKALDAIRTELMNIYKQDFTNEEISKKINNLRTQFIENVRKVKKQAPSGSGSESPKPAWWLYDSLFFLLPYLKKDKGISNIRTLSKDISQNTEVSVYEVPNTELDVPEGEYSINEEGALSPVNDFEDLTPTPSPASMSESDPVHNKQSRTTVPAKSAKRSKKRKGDDAVKEAMLTAIKQINGNENSEFSSDIEKFLQYVGVGLQQISNVSLYRKCKLEILGIIDTYQNNLNA